MSVLNRNDFFDRIQTVAGTDTSDETLAFIEDMTDTYNDLETRANSDGVDWEQRYHELDESWKAKYKQRFFSGNGSMPVPHDDGEKETPKEVDYEDLFE